MYFLPAVSVATIVFPSSLIERVGTILPVTSPAICLLVSLSRFILVLILALISVSLRRISLTFPDVASAAALISFIEYSDFESSTYNVRLPILTAITLVFPNFAFLPVNFA